VNNSYKALLIINPKSRQGGEASIDAGLEKLQLAGITVETVTTADCDHTAQEISARHKDVDFVIVGGGDGTISSTAQTLYEHKLPFAILPLGTANDLARSLGIPLNLDKAFDVIVANNRRPIDLGTVNGHYFFNACHLGLGVRITHELTPELKKKWGVLSYFKATYRALSRSSEFKVQLTVDGKIYRQRALELTVGNGRYYGGGNLVDENARIDDGMLNLSCIYPESIWELLKISPLIRLGKQDKAYRTFCVSGRQISVKTLSPMEIHADGEPATRTPANFEIVAGALQVFAPAEEAGSVSLLEKVKNRVAGQ
jgi:diacylglycerol kinase (ATP)